MATILSLDPSTAATGWALYEKKIISTCGFEPFMKVEGERDGDRLNRVHKWLLGMIRLFEVDLVILEAYFFRSRFAMGSDLNPEIRAAMKMACADCEIEFTTSIPSHWKKVVAGRMSPTRNEKRKWGKTKAKKIFTLKALEGTYGIKFPDKMPNPTTGNQINFKHDVSDALGILVAYLQESGQEVRFSGNLFKWDIGKEKAGGAKRAKRKKRKKRV